MDKVTASVETEFGPSAVYGKSNRTADLLCKNLLALVHSAVEEGEVLGVEFLGDEVGEVADLHRNLTKRDDEKAGKASRVVGVHLCLDGSSCVRVRAKLRAELNGGLWYSCTLSACFWTDAPNAVDADSELACPGASVLTSPRVLASLKRAYAPSSRCSR